MKIIVGFSGIRLIDPVEVFYLPGDNTFYPIISKSACSSIKLMLIQRFNPAYEAEFPEIHDVNPATITENRLQRIFFNKLSDYEKWAAGKKIIFVMREPVSRCYSCYLDIKSGKNIMYQYPSGLDWFMKFKPGLTLDQFLEKVSLLSDAFSDRHFRSQSFYLNDVLLKTTSSVETHTLGAYMKKKTSKSPNQKVAQLNKNIDSINSELKSELLNNQRFYNRYTADLELYSKILADE